MLRLINYISYQFVYFLPWRSDFLWIRYHLWSTIIPLVSCAHSKTPILHPEFSAQEFSAIQFHTPYTIIYHPDLSRSTCPSLQVPLSPIHLNQRRGDEINRGSNGYSGHAVTQFLVPSQGDFGRDWRRGLLYFRVTWDTWVYLNMCGKNKTKWSVFLSKMPC